MKSVLRVHNLTAGYRPREPIVRDLNLTLSEGEVLGVLGPNGAGKSTVLRALAGFCPHVEGRALLNDIDILQLGRHQRIRAGLGVIPRDNAIFPSLSVRENLAIGAFVARDRQIVAARMEGVLSMLPALKDILGRRADALSGGQAELVAIGLGLMSEPAALMIDEPSAGLSGGTVSVVVDALAAVVSARNVPLLLVEQNLGVAERLCTRFLVLESGGALMGEATDFRQAVGLLEATIEGSSSRATA